MAQFSLTSGQRNTAPDLTVKTNILQSNGGSNKFQLHTNSYNGLGTLGDESRFLNEVDRQQSNVVGMRNGVEELDGTDTTACKEDGSERKNTGLARSKSKINGKKKCTVCRGHVRTSVSLKAHVGKHVFSAPVVQCKDCRRCFSSKMRCLSHAEKTHDDWKGYTSKKTFVCLLCGRRFGTKRHCIDHMARHRKMKRNCKDCGWKFSSNFDVRVHRAAWHTCEGEPLIPVGLPADQQRTFPCPMLKCNQVFCTTKDVEAHVETTHKGKRKMFFCEECGRKFQDEEKRDAHRDNHEKMNYVCPVPGCEWKYDNFGDLQRHCCNRHQSSIKKKDESAYLIFKGDASDARIGTSSIAVTPKTSTHLSCTICNRPFKTNANLEAHVKNHAQMVYMCKDGCGYMYEQFKQLRNHYYGVHKSGLRAQDEHLFLGYEFPCREAGCGSTFKQFEQLRHHSISAHQKVIAVPETKQPKAHAPKGKRCKICNRSFIKEALLENHEENHDKMVYMCREQDCGFMYEKFPDLKSHVFYAHKYRITATRSRAYLAPEKDEDDDLKPDVAEASSESCSQSHPQSRVSLAPVGLGLNDTHNAMKYICRRCKKLFANFNYLQNHYFCDHSTELSVEDEPLCRIERIKMMPERKRKVPSDVVQDERPQKMCKQEPAVPDQPDTNPTDVPPVLQVNSCMPLDQGEDDVDVGTDLPPVLQLQGQVQ